MFRYVLIVGLVLGSGAAFASLGSGMQSAIRGVTAGGSTATAFVPRVGSQRQAGMASALFRGKLLAKFDPPGDGAIKAVFLDADGTVRKTIGSRPPNSPEEVALLDNVGEVTRHYADQGYFVGIVSNQAGIQFGHQTVAGADAALKHTVDLIREDGGVVHYFTFSESKKSRSYKPGIGMFEEIEEFVREEFGRGIDRENSIMVGDASYKRGKDGLDADLRPDGTRGEDFSNSDRRAAVNWGLNYDEARFFFGRERKTPAYIAGEFARGATRQMVRLLGQEWFDNNISTRHTRLEFKTLASPAELEESVLAKINADALHGYAREHGWTGFDGEALTHEFKAVYPYEIEDPFIDETARRVATDGFAYSSSYEEGVIALRENIRQTLRLLKNGNREPLQAVRSTVDLVDSQGYQPNRRFTRTLFINPNTLDAVSVISREGKI